MPELLTTDTELINMHGDAEPISRLIETAHIIGDPVNRERIEHALAAIDRGEYVESKI